MREGVLISVLDHGRRPAKFADRPVIREGVSARARERERER